MQGLSLWSIPETKDSWFGSFLSGTDLSQSSPSVFNGYLSEALRSPPNSPKAGSISGRQIPIMEILGERRPLDPLQVLYEDKSMPLGYLDSPKKAVVESAGVESGPLVSMTPGSTGNKNFSGLIKQYDPVKESEQDQDSVAVHPLALLADLSVQRPVALIVQSSGGQQSIKTLDSSPVTLVLQSEPGSQGMSGIRALSGSDENRILVDLPVAQDANGKRLPVFSKLLEAVVNQDSTNSGSTQPKDSAPVIQGAKFPVWEGVLAGTSDELLLSFPRMKIQQGQPPVFSLSSIENGPEKMTAGQASVQIQDSGKGQAGTYQLTLRFPVQSEWMSASSNPVTSELQSESILPFNSEELSGTEWNELRNQVEGWGARDMEMVSIPSLGQKFELTQRSIPVQVGFDPSTGIVFLTSQQDTPESTQVNAGEPSSTPVLIIQETLPNLQFLSQPQSLDQPQSDSGLTGKASESALEEISSEGMPQREMQNPLAGEHYINVRFIPSDSSQQSLRVWMPSSDVPSEVNQPTLLSLNSPEIGQFRQILDLLNVLGGSVEQISLSDSRITTQVVSLEAAGFEVPNSESRISSGLQYRSPDVVTQGTGESLNRISSDLSTLYEPRVITSESNTIQIPPYRTVATLGSDPPILEGASASEDLGNSSVFKPAVVKSEPLSGQNPEGQVSGTAQISVRPHIPGFEPLIAMSSEELIPSEFEVPVRTESLGPKPLIAMSHEEPIPPMSDVPVPQLPKPIALQAMQSYEKIPPEYETSSQVQTPLEKPGELPVISKIEVKVPTEPFNLIAKPVTFSGIQGESVSNSEFSQKTFVPEEVLVKDSSIGKAIFQEPSQGTAEVISVAESKGGSPGKPEALDFDPLRPVQISAKGFKATGFTQSVETSQGEMPISVSLAKEPRPVYLPELVQPVKAAVVQSAGKAIDPEISMGKESFPTNSIQQSWKFAMNSIRLGRPVLDMQQSSGFSVGTGNVSNPLELQQPLSSTQPVRVDLRSQVMGVHADPVTEFQVPAQPVEGVSPQPVLTQGLQPIRYPVPEMNSVAPRNGEFNLQSPFLAQSSPILTEGRSVVDLKPVEPMMNPIKDSSPEIQPDLLRFAATPSKNEWVPVLGGEETTPTGSIASSSYRWDLQAMIRDSLSGGSVDNSSPGSSEIQASPSAGVTPKMDILDSQHQTQVESTRIEMPPHRSVATLSEPFVFASEGGSDPAIVESRQPQVNQTPISLGKTEVNSAVSKGVVPIQVPELTRQDSGSTMTKEPVLYSGSESSIPEIVRTHPEGKVYPKEPVIVPEAPVQVREAKQPNIQQGPRVEFAMNETHEPASKEELIPKSEIRPPESTSSWMQLSNGRSAHSTDAVQQVKGLQMSSRIPESDSIINQIARQVSQRLTPGGGEMKLQLVPDDLGKLRIQVGVEDGIVRARIVTETAEVRSLLERHVNDLKIALGEQGLRIQEVKLTLAGGGEDYMAGSQGQNQGHRYSGTQAARNSGESGHYSQDRHPQEQERRPYPERWEKLLGNGQGHVDYRA